ncbi:MAG: hypothetical protein IT379_39575 [Deltaproteobacteria bacterium]|nr:hypothetical protein [Deltaproteobacteria bacterium]
MPRPASSPSISRAERVLRAIDQGSGHELSVLAAVVVCAPDARSVIVEQHTSWSSALADAGAIAVELALAGERNAGVVVISTLFRASTSEGWPTRADRQVLVADVAAVIAFARFIAWLVEQLQIRAMQAGAYDHPRAQTSNLELFGQLIGRGFPADAAAAIATGRVQ